MADIKRRPHGRAGGKMAPVEKAKDFKGTIKTLVKYIGGFKAAIIFVMFCAAASTIFAVIGPKVLGNATSVLYMGLMAQIEGKGSIDMGAVGMILLIALLLYAVSAAFMFIQGWIMTGITQKICYKMRKDISEKINRMPLKYFESRTYGEVLSRITNDVDTFGMGLNQSVTQIISSVCTVLGTLAMMLIISPIMTLIAISILPVSIFLISIIVKISQKHFRNQQKYLGVINGTVEESFSGHLIIKAFNKEKETLDDFEKTNDVLYKSAWKSQFLSGMMMPLMMFVGNLGYVPSRFRARYSR